MVAKATVRTLVQTPGLSAMKNQTHMARQLANFNCSSCYQCVVRPCCLAIQTCLVQIYFGKSSR